MKPSWIALFTVVAACVDSPEPPDVEALKGGGNSRLAGIWTGVATAQPGSPSGLDHDTWIDIACDGTTAEATYTYGEIAECESTLALTSVAGPLLTFADDSQTAGCTDGTVTLLQGTRAHAGELEFSWIYPSGTLDTRGWLTKIASAYCP